MKKQSIDNIVIKFQYLDRNLASEIRNELLTGNYLPKQLVYDASHTLVEIVEHYQYKQTFAAMRRYYAAHDKVESIVKDIIERIHIRNKREQAQLLDDTYRKVRAESKGKFKVTIISMNQCKIEGPRNEYVVNTMWLNRNGNKRIAIRFPNGRMWLFPWEGVCYGNTIYSMNPIGLTARTEGE